MIYDAVQIAPEQRAAVRAALRFGLLVAVTALLAACSPSRPASPGAAATTAPVPSAGTTASPGAAATTAPVPSVGTTASPSAGVSTPPPGVGSAAVASVTMSDALRFEPADFTIRKDTTVTWHNATSIVHTVTDDPSLASNKADAALPPGAQAWDSGDIAPGGSFSHTFDTPGTYKYFCKPHELAGMLGTITVTS